MLWQDYAVLGLATAALAAPIIQTSPEFVTMRRCGFEYVTNPRNAIGESFILAPELTTIDIRPERIDSITEVVEPEGSPSIDCSFVHYGPHEVAVLGSRESVKAQITR